MKWLKATYKKYRYWLWALGSLAVGLLLWVLKGTLVGGKGERKISLPEVPPALKEKVARVEEEALVARIEAKVTADTEIKELNKAVNVNDGKKRRERLAKLLENL